MEEIMSKPDLTIEPRLLESAKQEFLEKGFQEASLKNICNHANVTTGALYKRYKGKEELFCAVVQETVDQLNRMTEEKCSVLPESLTDEQLLASWKMDEKSVMFWFQFFYSVQDGFVLLIKCAEGTCYSNFQHDWVEKMTKITYDYYQEAQRRGLVDGSISFQEMHVLTSAFWTTYYEPFIHGFSMDEIELHCKLVCRLFNWENILRLQ